MSAVWCFSIRDEDGSKLTVRFVVAPPTSSHLNLKIIFIYQQLIESLSLAPPTAEHVTATCAMINTSPQNCVGRSFHRGQRGYRTMDQIRAPCHT